MKINLSHAITVVKLFIVIHVCVCFAAPESETNYSQEQNVAEQTRLTVQWISSCLFGVAHARD